MTPIGEDDGKNLHVIIHFIRGNVLTVYCDHLKARKNGVRLTIDGEHRILYLPYSNVLYYDIRQRGGSYFLGELEGEKA